MDEETVTLSEIMNRLKELELQMSKQEHLLELQNDQLDNIKEETRANDVKLSRPVTFKDYYPVNLEVIREFTEIFNNRFDKINEQIIDIDQRIGDFQEKSLRKGVLRKRIKSGEANIKDRLDYQTKQINELTDAHNNLVKNMDKLVLELQNAFSQVSNTIHRSHWTWTMGQGFSFTKRMN